MLRNTNINTRLFVAFSLILILMIILALGAFQGMEVLTDMTKQMYRHPLTVSNAVLDANTHIVAIHRSMKDVVLASSEAEIREAVNRVDQQEKEVLQRFQIVQERFLGDKTQVVKTLQTIYDWRQIREEVISLARSGQHDAAVAITRGRGAKHLALIEKEMDELIVFARNKAQEYMDNAEAKHKQVLLLMGILLLLVLLSSIVIAIVVTRNINREIAERKQAQNAVQTSETKFRTLYESSGDAVMLLDEERFIWCNPATLTMFGCATHEEFCSEHPADLSPPTQPDGTDSLTLANERISAAMKEGWHRFEWMHRRLNGEDFPAEVVLSAMKLEGRPVLQVLIRDISERKQAEEKIKHMANHDELTGLPTLRLGKDRLSGAIALARRYKSSVALLFLDLDGFKAVNDSMGHKAGDHVLNEVAARLMQSVRETDTVARIGGDEFIIILTQVDEKANSVKIAKNILEIVSRSMKIDGQDIYIGTSIGIALYPDHGETPAELIKKADEAMYVVKRKGKNNYAFA